MLCEMYDEFKKLHFSSLYIAVHCGYSGYFAFFIHGCNTYFLFLLEIYFCYKDHLVQSSAHDPAATGSGLDS